MSRNIEAQPDIESAKFRTKQKQVILGIDYKKLEQPLPQAS